MEEDPKLYHAWCERNKQPILEVFSRVLPSTGTVLEIGSGSGQHAEFFARNLDPLLWQPSEIDPECLASIRAWRGEAQLPNLLEPIRIDVLARKWPVGQVTAIFSANMVHIAPWECCLGLLAGAAEHVVPGGLLIFYGPFRINGRHTAESNHRFDESLRSRDPRLGIRDLEKICEAARGFELDERIEMPANNQTVILRRQRDAPE